MGPRQLRSLARALGLLGAAGGILASCSLDVAGIAGGVSGASGATSSASGATSSASGEADAGCPDCFDCAGEGEFWDASQKRCYRLVTTPKENWADARMSCMAWGGDLAGVSSTDELAFLTNTPAIKAEGDIWSGGYALSEACSFAWIDGEPWPSGLWAQGEPNGAGKVSCVSFYAAKGHFLDDSGCGVARPYLCERAPKESCGDGTIQAGEECDDAIAPTGTCSACRITCAQGEFKDPYTHHCYNLVTPNPPLTWSQARDACIASGGHLAVISSPEENALVAQQIVGTTWIGGEWNLVKDGYWDDAEPFCFKSWHKGEPSLNAEYCIEIYKDGTWNNQECSIALDYLCEREP